MIGFLAAGTLAVGRRALTRDKQILTVGPLVDAAVAGRLVAVRLRLQRRRQLDDLDERSLGNLGKQHDCVLLDC